jgi:signal transduction histidine kinase
MLQCATSALRVTRRGLVDRGEAGLAGTVIDALVAIDRANLLAHRLLSAASDGGDLSTILVQDVVLSMRSLLGHLLGESIRLDTLVREDLPPLLCDPYELENTILNLAINARDAMPGGGALIIEARECLAGTHAWPCITLSVRETGSGMGPGVAAQAFRAFFSTKGAGQGTGLGLSAVRLFAERIGGTAELRTGVPDGTCVTLHLPAVQEAAR